GIRSAKLITDGWLLHYNFFRPHESLGMTPAKAAGIDFPYRNWRDIVADGQKAGFGRVVASEIISVPVEMARPAYTSSGFKIVNKRRQQAGRTSARAMPMLARVR
ncbi:MAG: hypothetical protein SVP26_08040, partial [Chloroflexota bacterium]|nr:hypothetical protein [Chloroflexota bacterium]